MSKDSTPKEMYARTLDLTGPRRIWASNWENGHAVLYVDWSWVGWPYRRVPMKNWPMVAHSFNLWPFHGFYARYQ